MAMPMNAAPGTDEPEVMMDINTTPLIDVMLVLLIMLIITIPVQLHSVNLDMPRPAQQPLPTLPVVVRVEVEADNTVRWNGQRLADRAALQARMQEAAQEQPQPEIHIRAEPSARYATVAAVLASAQRHGLSKLGVLASEPAAH